MKAVSEKSKQTSINTKPFFTKDTTSNQHKPFFSPGKPFGPDLLTANKFNADIQQTDKVQTKQFSEQPDGVKVFNCPDYAGDTKLEACLNDQDRLKSGDKGASVEKVQRGLNSNLQENGIVLMDDGAFGQKTGQAVMFFKKKHNLGFENYPDVGPGTMGKLDELCATPGQNQPPKEWPTPPEIDGPPQGKLPPCPIKPGIDTQTEAYAFNSTSTPLLAIPGITCQLIPPPGKKVPANEIPTHCVNGQCHSLVKDDQGNIIQPDVILNPKGKKAHDLFQKLFTPVNELRFITQVDLVQELVRPAIQERIINVVAQKATGNVNSFFIQRGNLNSIINGLNTLEQAVNDPVLEEENVFLKDGLIPVKHTERNSKIDRIPGVPAEKKLLLERINGLKVLCKSQLEDPKALNDPRAADRQRVIAIALSQVGTVFGDIAEAVDPDAEQEGKVRVGYKRLAEYFATAFGDPSYLDPSHPNHEQQKHKVTGMKKKCKDPDDKLQDPVKGKCKDDQQEVQVKILDVQPEWCGIFVLWAFKSAGFSVGSWVFGTSIPHIAGFNKVSDKKVKPEEVKPGDVGMMNNNSHQFIIVRVNPDQLTLTTVDGNSNSADSTTGGQVSMHTNRPISKVDVGFYRVNELL